MIYMWLNEVLQEDYYKISATREKTCQNHKETILLSTHDSKFYTSRQFLFKIICTQIFSLNILLQGRGQTHFLTNMIKSVSLQNKD